MQLSPPAAPTQPNLGDPSTYNARALALFNYIATTFPNWLAGLDAADFFPVLGTVAQSGGKVTGTLMERGTSANGEWERFACGTQICTHTVKFPPQTAGVGSVYASTSDAIWNYPAQFTGAPAVSGFRRVTGLLWFAGPSIEAIDPNTQFRGRALNVQSNPSEVSFRMAAVGRWF